MDNGMQFGYEGAASILGDALRGLHRLEQEAEQYHYEMPPGLREDMKSEARRIRNAVRFLVSDEADEA